VTIVFVPCHTPKASSNSFSNIHDIDQALPFALIITIAVPLQ